MKKQFVIAQKSYGGIPEVEEKLTNRLLNGEKMPTVHVYEVKTVYDIHIKLKKRVEK
jgi:hypothetical protein